MAKAIELNGRQLTINTNANKGQGCYWEVLEQIDSQLTAMLSHHCKVLVLRFDLHLYEYTEANGDVSRFMRKVKKRLCRRYGLVRVGHVWVREIEKAKQQHYHCALIIDANKVNHPANILKLCEGIWQGWNHPKPFTPANCYAILQRGDDETYAATFLRLSYMAKIRGKGYKAKAANDYSTSRIEHKNIQATQGG